MANKLPPLNWLRTFESAARNMSFAHAADELSMTSAAVSKQIKNLEYKLGVELFVRLPSGLNLTDQGAAYLPVVREAVERLTKATNELFDSERSHVLNVKVSLVFSMGWLAPRVSQFYAQHPEIDLRISSSIWSNDGPLEAGTELEIRHGKGWSGLASERLTHDFLVPVCRPDTVDGNRLESISDLNNHSLLHVIGYREGWTQWLTAFGESRCSTRDMYYDTLLVALDMAERGLGVALARSSLVEERLQTGRLIAPLKERLRTDEAFYLVSRHKKMEPAAQAFRDWLVAEMSLTHAQ